MSQNSISNYAYCPKEVCKANFIKMAFGILL